MMMISKYLLALIFWPPNPSLLTSCLSLFLFQPLSPSIWLCTSFSNFVPLLLKALPLLVLSWGTKNSLSLSLLVFFLHSHMHHSHTHTWGTQMCSQAHTLPHTLSWEHAHTLSHPFKPVRTQTHAHSLSLLPSLLRICFRRQTNTETLIGTNFAKSVAKNIFIAKECIKKSRPSL